MNGPKQLRKYTLSSDEAAEDYMQHWHFLKESLAQFDVEVTAVWRSRRYHSTQVIAVLRYREGDDPEEVMERFMQSRAYESDMAGFDVKQIERLDVSFFGTPRPEMPA